MWRASALAEMLKDVFEMKKKNSRYFYKVPKVTEQILFSLAKFSFAAYLFSTGVLLSSVKNWIQECPALKFCCRVFKKFFA